MQMHTLVFNCRGWGLITRRRGDPEFLKRVVINYKKMHENERISAKFRKKVM